MAQASPWPALSPFDPDTMIESLDQSGYGLRIVFYRPGNLNDRWGHGIGVVQHGGTKAETVDVVLVSTEQDASDGWPASPPLQSLSIEQQDHGPVALAVGMANQCHWSASIEAVPNERRLIFDIACRVNARIEGRLRSYYQINAPIGVQAGAFVCDLPSDRPGTLRLSFGAEVQAHLEPVSFGLEAKESAGPTVRWKYEIRLSDR
jgi:hypothetical protein